MQCDQMKPSFHTLFQFIKDNFIFLVVRYALKFSLITELCSSIFTKCYVAYIHSRFEENKRLNRQYRIVRKKIIMQAELVNQDVFFKKRCSNKFCEIHRIPALEPFFNKVAHQHHATLFKKILQLRGFCNHFKNNFFIEHSEATVSVPSFR